MKNNIEVAMQRAQGYWFIDGLSEILSGIMLALLGTVFFFRAQVQNAEQVFSASNAKDTILILGLSLGMATVVWLKQKITYRRTGYVEPRLENFGARLQKYWKVIALIAGVPFVLILLMLVFPWARAGLFYGMTWIPAAIGFGFGIFMFVQAKQTGLKRFRILCYLDFTLAVMLVLLAGLHNLNHALPAQLFAGPLSGPMPAELAQAMQTNMDYASWLIAILCAGLGLSRLVSGIFTLARYLQANPPVEAGDE
ncbi:MAG: hypothetical protein CVU44_17040 [Chloroflexi bacterium HGW-Chloroflexi-6]|nr:MAG: hypothetical protein CVU44_17040 [Chloroflexi bacterium HGW-Chloroflexi-6]